jgi:hypothetical protein
MLKKFDADRAEFLRRLLQSAKKGRTWFSLDAEAAARADQFFMMPRKRKSFRGW